MTPIIEAVRRHNEQYNRGCTLTPASEYFVSVRTRDGIELCSGTEEFCTNYLNRYLPDGTQVPVTPSPGEWDNLRDALRINQEQLRNARAQLEAANKRIADMTPVAASSPAKDDLAEAIECAQISRIDVNPKDHPAPRHWFAYLDGGDGIGLSEDLECLCDGLDIHTAASAIRSAIESRRHVSRNQASAAFDSGDLDTLQKWIDQQREAGK